jgi:hypothetical protein
MLKLKHTEHGLYLLDLTIAALLASCIAVLSYPSFRDLKGRYALRAEARKLASALSGWSREALQQELEVHVEFTARGYSISRAENAIEHIPLSSPVEVDMARSNPSRLSFYPSGAATPSTLVLVNGDNSCLFSVSLRGRTTFECR